VLALDQNHLKGRYALVEELERQSDAAAESEALRLLAEILARQPDNLVALLERVRLEAKHGDEKALHESVAWLRILSTSWPRQAQPAHQALVRAVEQEPKAAALRVQFLKNVLVRTPAYRRSLDTVAAPPGVVGEPIEQFLKMAAPSPTPAPPDEALTFTVEPDRQKRGHSRMALRLFGHLLL
jgi:hypothetical protein